MTTPAQAIVRTIAEHGFAVQAVFQGPDTPAFAYTIGLSLAGMPELVVPGLPPQVSHGILTGAARSMIEGAIPSDFEATERHDGVAGVLREMPVSLRLLPDTPPQHDE